MSELHMVVRKDIGFWGDSLSMYVYTRDPSAYPGMVGVAMPLTFNWIPEGGIVPNECSLGGMKLESAVRLMDSLWEAGVRPSLASTSNEAEVKAMKQHIEDLRKLLWNRVGMEGQP